MAADKQKRSVSQIKIIIGLLLIVSAVLYGLKINPFQAISASNHVIWLNQQDSIPLRPVFNFQLPGELGRPELETAWFIYPEIEGEWLWRDENTAIWSASDPLPAGAEIEFGFRLDNLRSADISRNKITWKTEAREPKLLIAHPGDETTILTTVDVEMMDTENRITEVDGRIEEIAVSRDGRLIIYTMKNNSGGKNIWQIHMDGTGNELMVDCGASICRNMQLPMDPHLLYFMVNGYNSNQEDVKLADGIHKIDLAADQTNLVLPVSLNDDAGFSISPDARWLSIYLGEGNGIEIRDLFSNAVLMLEEASGYAGSWSADSSKLVFQKTIREGVFLRHQISILDLVSGKTEIIAGEDGGSRSHHYFFPKVNPVAGEIIVTAQANLNLPGKELWRISGNGNVEEKISTDLTRIITNYEWSPDGQNLFFEYLDFPLKDELLHLGILKANVDIRFITGEQSLLVTWLP